MKFDLAFFVQRWRLTSLCFGILALLALALRLASGPIALDGARDFIIDKVERDLPGSQVKLDHLELAWFAPSRALGIKVDGLVIKDHQGRDMLKARHVEAALAIESLLLFHLAPAQLTADHFDVHLAVSKEGRYAIGYESQGRPEDIGDLKPLIDDLTGHEVLGRPLSFTRLVVLNEGVLHLNPPGHKPEIKARLVTLNFLKTRQDLRGALWVEQAYASNKAAAHLILEAKTGLKSATLKAEITDLNPSQLFANVVGTAAMARLDAPISGKADVIYHANTGMDLSRLQITAGAGTYDFGEVKQAFKAVHGEFAYVPHRHEIQFEHLNLSSRLIEADLNGSIQIHAADLKHNRPLSFGFDIEGPQASGKLADDFAAQTLKSIHFIGRFTPDQRRLHIDHGQGYSDKALVETHGDVWTNEKGEIGADLRATIKGDFSKETVFAFWPDTLSEITRDNLIERIKGGVYSNAVFSLTAEPGHITADNLRNSDLRLDFDFRSMGMMFDHRMQDATDLKGHGILLGDRFVLKLDSGKLKSVNLTRGGVLVPSFHEHGTKTQIWLESEGDAVNIIQAVDPVTSGQLERHGFNRERLSGRAHVRLDIDFPTFEHITERNLSIKFDAHMKAAGLKRAAMGWDLIHGDIRVTGDMLADRLDISGPAELGPFKGEIAYRSAFVPHQQDIKFQGSFDAAPFGGSPHKRVPISGQVILENNSGKGEIDSAIFRGGLSWSTDPAVKPVSTEAELEPTTIRLDGHLLSAGLTTQGWPIFSRLGPEIPFQLGLARGGNIWSGSVSAESLSGSIAYVEGKDGRIVYRADIDPDEARQLGFGGLPLFRKAQEVTLNIGIGENDKNAIISVGKIRAQIGWKDITSQDNLSSEPASTRTIVARLSPEDLHELGLPSAFFQPMNPVEIQSLWTNTETLLTGQIVFKTANSEQALNFQAPQTPSDPSQGVSADKLSNAMVISGIVSSEFLNAIGYRQTPLRLTGNIGLDFRLNQTGLSYAGLLSVDGHDVDIGLSGSEWHKPIAEPAAFSITFDEADKAGGLNMTQISASGAKMSIEGRAAIDASGQLKFADFSHLYLDKFSDMSLKIYRNNKDKNQVTSIAGAYFDLSPFLELKPNDVSNPAQDHGINLWKDDGYKNRWVIDLAHLKIENSGFSKFSFDADMSKPAFVVAHGKALSANGTPVFLDIHPLSAIDSKIAMSQFTLTSDDFGDVIKSATGISTFSGGKGQVKGLFTMDQIDFLVQARHIKAKEIPPFAQILTLASLKGLADTLSGEGIEFKELYLPVRIQGETIFIKDGYAKGAALGVNIHGLVRPNQRLDLDGVLIPAYTLNSVFGDLPTHGQGLIGMQYHLGGGLAQPEVGVNPLSLIVPRYVKGWFEKPVPDPIAPLLDPTTVKKAKK